MDLEKVQVILEATNFKSAKDAEAAKLIVEDYFTKIKSKLNFKYNFVGSEGITAEEFAKKIADLI